MHQRMRLLATLYVTIGLVLAACGSGGATVTPPAAAPSATLPDASATPYHEASSAEPTPTFAPDTASSTPLPTPALPSSDGGPVPTGAIARLGIGSINAVALSPDGQRLAVGTTVGMYVYDANTFERLWAQPIEAAVKGIAWSPDGRLVVVWFVQSPIVAAYDGVTGREQLTLEQSGHIGDVDWSPDGDRLVVGWSGHCICYQDMSPNPINPRISVWDVTRSELVFTRGAQYPDPSWTPPVDDVEWSPDGSMVAMVTEINSMESIGAVILWDAQTGAQEHVLEHEYMKYAAFSPDGQLLATWTADTGTDAPHGSSNVWLWNVATGELEYTLEGHDGYVYAVAWSPDGTRLASGASADDGAETIIWDALTGKQQARASNNSTYGVVLSIDWSPDGRYLVSGIYDTGETGGMMVWDTIEGYLEAVSHDHQSPVEMVTWVADSRSFITASSDAVFLCNLEQSDPFRAIHGIKSYVAIHNLAWLSNASLVATNSYNTVVEWDIPSRQPNQISDGAGIAWEPESVEISPEGALHADIVLTPVEIGYSERHHSKVIVKDASEASVYEFSGPQADHLLVKWSPDGTRLAVGGGLGNTCKIDPFAEGWEENTVMVWDITTGELLHTFLGHAGRVYSLAWSPDGSMLASGSADGTVILWGVSK